MKSTKREGFTLVELLIVIVVIGILSAMMMLSSTEAVSSAKANNIISNMRNLKTAVLGWYVDNLSRVVKYDGNKYKITDSDGSNGQSLSDFVKSDAGNKEILKYLNNGGGITLTSKEDNSKADTEGVYLIKDDTYKSWYICCRVNDANVKNKLASRAASVGLVGKAGATNDTVTTPYTNQNYVCMLILKLED